MFCICLVYTRPFLSPYPKPFNTLWACLFFSSRPHSLLFLFPLALTSFFPCLSFPAVADRFIDAAKGTLFKFFGPDPKASDSFGRMVNDTATQRLASYIEDARPYVVYGGDVNIAERYIGPTLLDFGDDFEAFSKSKVRSFKGDLALFASSDCFFFSLSCLTNMCLRVACSMVPLLWR